ncbi:MAG: hypothetical protein ACJASB_000250 [Shewanella psychromarinicola]|jgi:hypothetical protein
MSKASYANDWLFSFFGGSLTDDFIVVAISL